METNHLPSDMILDVIAQASEAVFITDPDGVLLYVNKAFEKLTGFSREEALGRNASLLKSGVHPKEYYKEMWDALKAGKPWNGRFYNRRKDGTIYLDAQRNCPIMDASGKIKYFLALRHDISREVDLEKALLQSQKMEALGRFAGAIAHDFNNILTVVSGFGSLLAEEPAVPPDLRPGAKEIVNTSARGKELIGQLLAFSRHQPLERAEADLNAIIIGITSMLQSLLQKKVTLKLDLAPDLCTAYCNRGQIEQVIVNLAINARDAMPDGGTLTITTSNSKAEDKCHAAPCNGANSGKCLELSVADTGTGIPPEVLPKIFEPLYTTKEPGKGSGLGLATVYSIVTQHGGKVDVKTQLNKGTTFTICLPPMKC